MTDHPEIPARWINRAHGLLLNAASKRAWGE